MVSLKGAPGAHSLTHYATQFINNRVRTGNEKEAISAVCVALVYP